MSTPSSTPGPLASAFPTFASAASAFHSAHTMRLGLSAALGALVAGCYLADSWAMALLPALALLLTTRALPTKHHRLRALAWANAGTAMTVIGLSALRNSMVFTVSETGALFDRMSPTAAIDALWTGPHPLNVLASFHTWILLDTSSAAAPLTNAPWFAANALFAATLTAGAIGVIAAIATLLIATTALFTKPTT